MNWSPEERLLCDYPTTHIYLLETGYTFDLIRDAPAPKVYTDWLKAWRAAGELAEHNMDDHNREGYILFMLSPSNKFVSVRKLQIESEK